MQALKFAEGSETEIEGLLAPYGGPFAGRDIAGEYFSGKTDFCLDWFPDGTDRPFLYQHGMDGQIKTAVVGRVKSVYKTDLGLWMKAQLDAANEYYSAIKQLIEEGKLFLSSGSMNHLVQVAKSGEILRWPLVEGSATPTPANLFARLGMAEAKSHYKAIASELPLKVMNEGDDTAGGYVTGKRDASSKSCVCCCHECDCCEPKPVDGCDCCCHECDCCSAAEGAKASKTKAITGKKTMDGSLEDLLQDLDCLINPRNPFFVSDDWACVIATFLGEPNYFLAKKVHYDCECEETYWRCEFTIDERGEPVLGKIEQVEQCYLPVSQDDMTMAGLPVAIQSATVAKYAAALLARTKDLQQRRIKEGRTLSTANRSNLEDCLQQMRGACDALQELLDSTVPQSAKAATVRREFELWRMYADTL